MCQNLMCDDYNLNAQAITSLKGQLGSVRSDVSALVVAMEKSINDGLRLYQDHGKTIAANRVNLILAR